MSEASTNADPTSAGTERALTLTTKKKPRTATTRKKTTAKAATKKAATAKKTTTPKTTAHKRTTKKAAGTTPRKRATTTNPKRSSVSLKADLKKLTAESYATADFTRRAVLIQGEGVEILRDALMVMLASKTPLIGGMVSSVTLETLLDKVADTYRDATVADRKALRAVINWLRGDANTDEATQQHLVALLNG